MKKEIEESNLDKESGKNKKCFVMMPFTDPEGYPQGHFKKVYDQIIKPAVEESGFNSYRVDENKICDSIINKIFEAVNESDMAICDLSGANPNVLYELGLRQAYDKPVVLIQDDSSDRIFDVSGISTVMYKRDRLYENVIEAKNRIMEALKETENGKNNKSIINILKVKKATVENKNVTDEQNLEIKFNIILDEIEKIKRNVEGKDRFKKYENIRFDCDYNWSLNDLENEIESVINDYSVTDSKKYEVIDNILFNKLMFIKKTNNLDTGDFENGYKMLQGLVKDYLKKRNIDCL